MLKEFSDPATSKQIGEHLKHNQIALLELLYFKVEVELLPAKHFGNRSMGKSSAFFYFLSTF